MHTHPDIFLTQQITKIDKKLRNLQTTKQKATLVAPSFSLWVLEMDRHPDWPPAVRSAVRLQPPSRAGTLFPPYSAALKNTHTQDCVKRLQYQHTSLPRVELEVSPSKCREFTHCPGRCSCVPVSDSARTESTGASSGQGADRRP